MKKLLCLAMAFLLLCITLCGCGAKAYDNETAYEERVEAPAEDYLYSEDVVYGAVVMENGSAFQETSKETTSVASNRKLIRKLSLSVETENYAELLARIEAQVLACGGYVENMEASTRYSSTTRYATLVIRVPVDQLDNFAGFVGEVSNVVYRTESNEDITTTYVDTQSRRDALQVEHDRLLELLKKAENLSEILEIESRLTDVRYQLQNIESQLRTYDNLVAYSTVTLSVSEVKVYTVTEEKGFWADLGDRFVNSLKGVWNFIKDLFAFCIVSLPYLLLLSIVPLSILLPILISIKKRRARRLREAQEKKEDQQQE